MTGIIDRALTHKCCHSICTGFGQTHCFVCHKLCHCEEMPDLSMDALRKELDVLEERVWALDVLGGVESVRRMKKLLGLEAD